MGIEILKMPEGSVDAGIFNLPPAFDTKRYAAHWVEEGQVQHKQQRQVLVGTNKTADGWDIWRLSAKAAPTTTVGSGNKKFVLMCRSKEVQNEVNAIYGNVSKARLNNEIEGKTVAGESKQDPGMISEDRLKNIVRGDGNAAEESLLPLNEEEISPAATT